jgi:hypothetical protein
MEQASKRTSSHEGGLLLDPLHKKIQFSSVPMDREDRHQRVSAQVESVSGYKIQRNTLSSHTKFVCLFLST